MVNSLTNPLNIIIITLLSSFLLPLIYQKSEQRAVNLFFAVLAAFVVISLSGYLQLLSGLPTIEVLTAGIEPPFSINLRFGIEEAFVTLAINVAALLGAWYLLPHLKTNAPLMLLFLIWIMGMNGMVMTRDLFNLFIFVEITAISTFVLIGFNRHNETLSAGFKYILAGSLASSFLLLGTMLLYFQTGTLNIDDLVAHQSLLTGPIGTAGLVLIMTAILIELKPYPANGWGLDVYQAAPTGVSALISVGVSASYLFALYKLLPLFDTLLPLIAIAGGLTFVMSNFMGLKQNQATRLLGYSSVGQVGLLVMALALLSQTNQADHYLLIAGGLFINHFLAKAGLFWLAGLAAEKDIKHWSHLKQHPVIFVLFVVLLAALAGLPPFPAFWAKWALVHTLVESQHYIWVGCILLGSLLEAVYLFRWYGYAKSKTNETAIVCQARQTFPIKLMVALLLLCGHAMAINFGLQPERVLLPVYAALAMLLLHKQPSYTKALVTLLITGIFTLQVLPTLTGLSWIFGMIFLVGSWVLTIGSLYKGTEQRPSYYPLLVMLILSLGSLLLATTTLEFFLAWEFMTVSSYLMVSLGKNAEKSSLQYLAFSLAGAFFILAGFALAYSETHSMQLSSFAQLAEHTVMIITLLLFGFLIKLGGLGVHVWLPGVYTDTDDDFTAIMSSIVSKAGLFGLFAVGIHITTQFNDIEALMFVLGWFGLVMALAGALMAVFQEDVKKLLAYSSVGQMGYIITGFALTSHMGWVASMYLAVNHVLYKGLIFLAIAGVLYRTNTRLMYKMGGLIKNMPISFVSVMIGIIAISGVPPLLGFGGKWMMYNALVEKGWYLQTAMAFFASAVAFLYLFRLIHKDNTDIEEIIANF